MDSSKGHRQLLGLESPASEHQEFSQNETDMNEANRQRTALESTGDGFQEFVAFLDRIQYRKAKEMKLGRSEERSRREDLDVKVIKTKLPWIPSFELEDFCVSAIKNSMSAAERNMCDPSANEPVSSEQKETWSSSDSPRQNMFLVLR